MLSAVMAAADMLGRAHSQGEILAATRFLYPINVDPAFAELIPEGVTPEAAAAYIRDKIAMTKVAYQSLLRKNRRRYRDYAFYISKTESIPLIETAQEAVARAIEQGTTLEDFRKTMREAYRRLGVTPLDPFHVETVFRTNIQSAYQVGRWQEMRDPDVMKALPYWQYRAIMDSRVRPAHAAMNGFIARGDDPVWMTWYPPRGFNCRCTVSAITRQEAARRAPGIDLDLPGIDRLPRIDGRKAAPDAGFEDNPIVRFEKIIASRKISR